MTHTTYASHTVAWWSLKSIVYTADQSMAALGVNTWHKVGAYDCERRHESQSFAPNPRRCGPVGAHTNLPAPLHIPVPSMLPSLPTPTAAALKVSPNPLARV